jgi:hypothetical protein
MRVAPAALSDVRARRTRGNRLARGSIRGRDLGPFSVTPRKCREKSTAKINSFSIAIPALHWRDERAVTFICQCQCYRSASAAARHRRRAMCGFVEFEWSRASRTATSCVENGGGGPLPNFLENKTNNSVSRQIRHGRACPGHPCLRSSAEVMDGRHGAGQDGRVETGMSPPIFRRFGWVLWRVSLARREGGTRFRENNHTRCRGVGAVGRNSVRRSSCCEHALACFARGGGYAIP